MKMQLYLFWSFPINQVIKSHTGRVPAPKNSSIMPVNVRSASPVPLCHRRSSTIRICHPWGSAKGVQPSPNRARTLLQIEDEPVGRVPIQVVSVEPFTAQKAQALVQLHRGGVGEFGFEDNLADTFILTKHPREDHDKTVNIPRRHRARSSRQ